MGAVISDQMQLGWSAVLMQPLRLALCCVRCLCTEIRAQWQPLLLWLRGMYQDSACTPNDPDVWQRQACATASRTFAVAAAARPTKG